MLEHTSRSVNQGEQCLPAAGPLDSHVVAATCAIHICAGHGPKEAVFPPECPP